MHIINQNQFTVCKTDSKGFLDNELMSQYNEKVVFLEFYYLLSLYFWGRVFDNLGGAGEQIKILGHLFTPDF